MRPGKHVLVWAVALMMIANPASACRWRARSLGGAGYYGGGYCASGYSDYYAGADCGGYAGSDCGGYAGADCGGYADAGCGVSYDSGCDSGCGTAVESGCSGCEVSGEDVTTNHLPSDAPVEVPIEPSTPQPTFAPSEVPAAPSAPPAEAPMTPPAPRATTPTPAPAAPPAARPTPAAPTPAAPTPAAPTPAPKSEVEDLFSEPAPAAAPTPETKPAEPAEVEDLFKDPAPAPTPEKPSDNVDDLFKDLDDSKENKAAASEAPAEGKANEGELEELFSDPQPAEPMATAASTPQPAVAATQTNQEPAMRLWTDNTGKFQVRGRLVMVGKTHVRLLKENGKFTTVPYGRLSQIDLAFVRSQTDPAVVANF